MGLDSMGMLSTGISMDSQLVNGPHGFLGVKGEV